MRQPEGVLARVGRAGDVRAQRGAGERGGEPRSRGGPFVPATMMTAIAIAAAATSAPAADDERDLRMPARSRHGIGSPAKVRAPRLRPRRRPQARRPRCRGPVRPTPLRRRGAHVPRRGRRARPRRASAPSRRVQALQVGDEVVVTHLWPSLRLSSCANSFLHEYADGLRDRFTRRPPAGARAATPAGGEPGASVISPYRRARRGGPRPRVG